MDSLPAFRKTSYPGYPGYTPVIIKGIAPMATNQSMKTRIIVVAAILLLVGMITPVYGSSPSDPTWAEAGGDFVTCANITTYPATNVGISTATLNGNYTGTAGENVWFRYGTSHALPLATNVQNATTSPFNFSDGLTSLMPGKTYYYRAGCACGYGAEESFTMLSPTDTIAPIPTVYQKEFRDALTEGDITGAVNAGISQFELEWGSIFFGILIMFLLTGVYLRQETPVLPAFIAVMLLMVGAQFLAPEFQLFVMAAMALIGAGIVFYSIVGGKKE